MSLADQRTQIKTILEGVSGIGKVYAYQRWANDWQALLKLFKTTSDKINAWMITREKTSQIRMTMGEKERAHIFLMRGLYGLNDSDGTELIFQDLIEDIVTAFDAAETLNDTARTTNPDWGPMADSVGLQVDIVEQRVFGSVLCHYAECRLCAIEVIEDEID